MQAAVTFQAAAAKTGAVRPARRSVKVQVGPRSSTWRLWDNVLADGQPCGPTGRSRVDPALGARHRRLPPGGETQARKFGDAGNVVVLPGPGVDRVRAGAPLPARPSSIQPHPRQIRPLAALVAAGRGAAWWAAPPQRRRYLGRPAALLARRPLCQRQRGSAATALVRQPELAKQMEATMLRSPPPTLPPSLRPCAGCCVQRPVC